MNPLETLKEKLKVKPIVHNTEGIKINIAPPTKDINNIVKPSQPIKINIEEDRDKGEKAEEILERMKRYKLTKVSAKLPENTKTENTKTENIRPEKIESVTTPVKKEPEMKKKMKKQPIEFIIEEDNPLEEGVEGVEGEEGVETKEGEKGEKKGKKEGEKEEETKEGQEIEEKEQIKEEVKKRNRVEIEETQKKLNRKKLPKGIVELGDTTLIQIGDTSIQDRLPVTPKITIRASSYYMNNREIFVNFINGLFEPYKENLLDETQGISCDTIGNTSGDFSLLTHQKLVRDYMNLFTPYRGLLLYHGLGSGKSCTSIGIAESMKSGRKVIIMTPASLRRNYLEEIKKCGDLLYRKNQFWEWISTESNPEYEPSLSAVLSLPIEYIRKRHGAWLVNIKNPSNYNELSTSEKKTLNDQLDEMIQNKFTFINYNGLRKDKFRRLTNNYENNIFDNAVVIIDESHNLISRIVNKINKSAKFSEKRGPGELLPKTLALQLYEFLLRAENCRVVLLSGTPIINYPNEIGILFNILRGYIKTWNFTLNVETTKKITTETLRKILFKEKILDYLEYNSSSKILTITRNPYGFENKITENSGYKGVTNEKKERKDDKGKIVLDERGTMTDDEFVKRIVKLLKKEDITVIPKGTTYTVNTALPDTLDSFVNNFINKETGSVVNIEKFKRRIIGLTSYFRSAQEELLPKYDKTFDYHVERIPMSDYQFQLYETARYDERKSEKSQTKGKSAKIDNDGLFMDPISTYRIFSRLFCNFAMPNPPGRPTPKDTKMKQWKKHVMELLKKDGQNDEILEEITKYLEKHFVVINSLSKEEKEKIIKDITEYSKNKSSDKIKISFEEFIKDKLPAKKDTSKQHGGSDEFAMNIDISDIPADEEEIKLPDYKDEDANLRELDELEGDEVLETLGDDDYKSEIANALSFLKKHKSTYLSKEGLRTYSPKYLAILENIEDPEHRGLNLIYSQFRSMEGIGIFALTLEANGFARFKIKKTSIDSWELNMSEEDIGKPTYALYTGTEDSDEREIIRNIYNGDWNNIPNNIATQLKAMNTNNNMGEIIKVLMITAAGSEGINLRNTRYVHLMEPYWHPVRTEQVIGRARRICSHKDLPLELQTVEVYLYLSIFTPEQLKSEYAIELVLKDVSPRTGVPQSSDEKLFEISNIKENLTSQLLIGVKETSIDCATHIQSSNKEGLVCLTFGQPSSDTFSYNPNYSQDENDTVAAQNKTIIEWEAQKMSLPDGRVFAFRTDNKQIYDYESYLQAKKIPGVRPILIGELVTQGSKTMIKKIVL